MPFCAKQASYPTASSRSLRKSHRHHRSLLETIQRRSRPGGGSISAYLLGRAIDLYLSSTGCKAVALSRADAWLSVKRDLFSRAEALDVMAPFRQQVPWRFAPRKSGPPRCVVSLPWELNAIHRLAAELVYAQVEPGPHIFQWRDRGRDRAAVSLTRLIENHGQHVLLADVRQCFASVSIDAVASLNLLPLELVRNALDYRQLRFRQYKSVGVPVGMEEVEQTAPRGLLEGSAASNPLLAALFNDLASHLNRRVVPLMFGDNIAVVAKSEKACSQAEKDLVRYFADHFAGPFFLTLDRFGPGKSFEWLGYAFDRQKDGSVQIAYSNRNWVKVLRELHRHPNLRFWGDAEKITADLIKGFPAVSDSQRETLFMAVSNELDAVSRGL